MKKNNSKRTDKMTEEEKIDKATEEVNETAEVNESTDTETSEVKTEEKKEEKKEESRFKFNKDKKKDKDKKDEEIAQLKDQLLRNMAEYENYRKRTAKERIELEPEITAKIVSDFLPIVDSIERALQNECTDANYKKGIEMIYQNFMDAFDKFGVVAIETDGADFDPSVHQAVQQIQDDTLESGKIATTFQKGYKIGDKILRFAMVTVVA